MTINRSPLRANRYEIREKLGEGGMGVVYEAFDRLKDRRIAFKELNVRADYDDRDLPAELVSLANEFQILGRLRHPNIVSVLDYGFDEAHQPYFTMDLLDSAETIVEYSRGKSIERQTGLGIQLMQAMSYLHQRDVIHRDLKPLNVLVTVNGTVKVLDFGLALAAHTSVSGTTSGTLAYMAPEVLRGEGASQKSDLYSLGLLLYEMYAQTYPFDTSDANEIVQSILNAYPDLSLLPDEVVPVIGRLLHKDPDERYDTVTDALMALRRATDYDQLRETLAIRDSYLQAANFIDRQAAIREVWQGIELTIDAREGDFVLVGGESGVGKTRFVSELRVRAIVEPMLVIRTTASPDASGLYYLWRTIIERLVLITEIDAWEASALKRIIPDIERLVGQAVAEPEELSGDGEKERLLMVMRNLLARQTQPMLFILEDLHWAKSDSLNLLRQLTTDTQAIFYLATYRSDETPDLPTSFDNATTLQLDPFDTTHIQELTQSILGDIGESPQIVAFLKRETEGNALFVIEVLRALADEAGNLRAIAQMDLPDTIMSGGILAVLQQRLERLPPPMLDLLKLVALYRREIDLRLTGQLADEVDLQEWLQAGEQASVLRVEDDTWMIAHDKIREQLVHDSAQDETRWRESHHKIAVALEALYADDPSKLPALAYHWTQAEVAEAAVAYNHQAAHLIALNGTDEALDYIDAAESFDDQIGTLSPETKALRSSIRGLSHYVMGDMAQAQEALEQTLVDMGIARAPSNTVGAVLGIVKQLGRQISHRLLPATWLHRRDSDWVQHKMMLGIRSLPMIYGARNNMANALWAALLELNTMESFKRSDHTHPLLSYANMHFLMSTIPLRPVARLYRQLVMQVLDDPQEVEQLAPFYEPTVRMVLGFTDMFAGRWQVAIDGIQDGLDRWRAFGDLRNIELASLYLGQAYQFAGQLQQAQTTFVDALQQSLQRNDPELILKLSLVSASLLLRRDDMTSDSHPAFEFLVDNEAPNDDHFRQQFDGAENYAFYYVIRANVDAQAGDFESAWHHLQQVPIDDIPTNNKDIAYHDLYERLAFTASLLLERSSTSSILPPHQDALIDILNHAAEALDTYGQAFVFSDVSAQRYRALLASYRNQPDEAVSLMEVALQAAEKHQMPLEEALTHDARTHLEALSSDERARSARRARELSDTLGGLYLISSDS